MRKFVVIAALSIAAGLANPAHAQDAPRLELSFDAAGAVTLRAHRVTVRQILAEWARQCGCLVVNADKLTGGPLQVPVEFQHETQARDGAGTPAEAPLLRRAGAPGVGHTPPAMRTSESCASSARPRRR